MMRVCRAASMRLTRAARSATSWASSPDISTNSQAAPSGSSGTACGPLRVRTTSTMRESRPSQAVGLKGSTAGTASPAAPMFSNPSTTMVLYGRSATSRTPASSTTASVPSLPTSMRRRSNPRSGSRCSSEYPETCRPNRPSSVRMVPSSALTSERSALVSGDDGVPSAPRCSRVPEPVTTSRCVTLSAVRP